MNIRQQQAEQTKQRILAAAYQIVREEGIHTLSSPKIIEAAGISKGGFFHHFPQIEDLYLYMLEHLIQQFDANLTPHKFNDFREFIRATTNTQCNCWSNRRKRLPRSFISSARATTSRPISNSSRRCWT
ncbi:MAG: TetR/AcrR family transcriptional regulator [Caldilineaceae bacterium]